MDGLWLMTLNNMKARFNQASLSLKRKKKNIFKKKMLIIQTNVKQVVAVTWILFESKTPFLPAEPPLYTESQVQPTVMPI